MSQLTDGGGLAPGDLLLASKGSVSNKILFEDAATNFRNQEGVEANAEVNAAENVGTGNADIYTGTKNGSALQFRTLDGNSPVSVAENGNAVEISWTAPYRSVLSDANASRGLTLPDRDAYIQMTSASANTIDVPDDVSVNFPMGSEVHVVQAGTGQTTIQAAGGASILHAGAAAARTRAQYSAVTLIKVAADTWHVHGDLVTS